MERPFFFFVPHKLRSYLRFQCTSDLASLPQGQRVASEKNKRGGELREGKTCHKTLPQKRFWTPPHLWYDFPPAPLCSRNVILLRGNGHRPDKSHFLRPPKLGLERALYSTFPPPPQNRTIRFAPPPPLRIPNCCVVDVLLFRVLKGRWNPGCLGDGDDQIFKVAQQLLGRLQQAFCWQVFCARRVGLRRCNSILCKLQQAALWLWRPLCSLVHLPRSYLPPQHTLQSVNVWAVRHMGCKFCACLLVSTILCAEDCTSALVVSWW